MAIVNCTVEELVFAEKPKSPKFEDLTGRSFNRLTVLGFAGIKNTQSFWYLLCKCGRIVRVYQGSLKSGATKSCGCWNAQQTIEANIKRSGRDPKSTPAKEMPEYYIYRAMVSRCESVNTLSYPYYGGRGIKVCLTFEEFLQEVGPRPGKNYTIDRINGEKNYEKGNIRWALMSQQNRNKRNNIYIEYEGQNKVLADWAIALNKERKTLWFRIFKFNWCTNHAFTLSKNSRKPKDCPDCNKKT